MEAYLEVGGRYVPTMFLLRIPSTCESVYREIFVPHREIAHKIVSLKAKPWDLRGL